MIPSWVSNVVARLLPMRSVFIMLDVVHSRELRHSDHWFLLLPLTVTSLQRLKERSRQAGKQWCRAPSMLLVKLPGSSVLWNSFHCFPYTTTPISCLIHFTDHSLAYQSHAQNQRHHHYIPSMDMYYCYCCADMFVINGDLI